MSDNLPAIPQYGFSAPPLPKDAWLDPRVGEDACPWLDEYVDYSATWSPRSYYGYHEAIGLWLLSTIAARRVAFNFGGVRYTSLYILLFGRTTLFAKTSAVQIGRDLMRQACLDYLLLPDDITPQNMIAQMADRSFASGGRLAAEIANPDLKITSPAQRGWFYDEFGMNIQAMMKINGPHAEFRRLLCVLDDGEDTYERGTQKWGVELIRKPYLALLGAMTPVDLTPFASAGSSLWSNGYLARMGLVAPPGDLINDLPFPRGQRSAPPNLLEKLLEWHKRLGPIQLDSGFPAAKILEPDEKVISAHHQYDLSLRRLLRSFRTIDLDGNYGRFAEKTVRIAALFASLDGSPTIQVRHWVKAQGIVENWRWNLHDLYHQVNRESIQRKITSVSDRVLRTVSQRAQPTKREVEQYTGLTAEQLDPILNELVKGGKLHRVPSGKTFRYQLPAGA